MLIIFFILCAAVAVGLVLNYIVEKKTDAEKNGATVRDVLGASALLAALLIAIVLSGSSSSYSAARTAAVQEANALDNLYESAEYMAQPARQAIHSAALCYARAVMGPEWEAMARGESSPMPNIWTGLGPHGIRKTLIAMTPEAPGFGLVVAADQKRGDLRSDRLIQAKPTVPAVLSWLMLILVGLSLGGLAYSIPRKNNVPHFVALGIVTVLFALVLSLIHNFDRPFSGVLALESSAMQRTAQDIGEDYAATYGVTPPCDERGQPR